MRRYTKQRNVILKVLTDAGRPLSVDELFQFARKELPGLGLATVYRNLKALQLQGLIVPVDLPGHPARWEVVPESHHHHFLCNKCDKLFEIHGCPEDIRHLLPEGYVLEEHDILLRGQCAICAGSNNMRINPGAEH